MQVVTSDTSPVNGILKWLLIFLWSVMISTSLTWTKQLSCWTKLLQHWNRSLSQAVKFCLLQQRNRLRTLLLKKFLISTCRSWLKDGRVVCWPTSRQSVRQWRKWPPSIRWRKTVLSTTFQNGKNFRSLVSGQNSTRT